MERYNVSVTIMCPQLPKISLLHDGEIASAAQHEVREHLAACDECAAEWASLQSEAKVFFDLHFDARLSMIEQSRLDRRISETFADRLDWIEIRRTAGLLSGLAASILVISSIWLVEFPSRRNRSIVSPAVVVVSERNFSSSSPSATAGSPIAMQGDTPAWERVAQTLQVDPRPEDAPNADIGTASAESFDSSVADWMVGGLK